MSMEKEEPQNTKINIFYTCIWFLVALLVGYSNSLQNHIIARMLLLFLFHLLGHCGCFLDINIECLKFNVQVLF